MSWFSPVPYDEPIRMPRQIPALTVPSRIRDVDQRLNLLLHHGAGGEARDYSGYANHGTIFGATWIDGSWGWALDFNGTNYVNCGRDASLNLTTTGKVTVEAWINVRSHPTLYPGILGKWVAPYQFILQFDTQRLRLSIRDGGFTFFVRDVALFPTLQWRHVAGKYDGTELRIYINGTQPVPAVAHIGGLQDAPLVDMLVGAETPITGLFDGMIALPKVYSVARADADILRSFEMTRGLFGV